MGYSQLSRFQKLDYWMKRSHGLTETSFLKFTKDKSHYRNTESDLVLMSFNDFLEYVEDNYTLPVELYKLTSCLPHRGNKQVYLLVDISKTRKHTMNAKQRRMYRKCGKRRRNIMKMKYHYIYHWSRVHAYLVVEHSPGKADNKTLAINILCSSNYSNIKGIGSYMMKTLITMSSKVGYKNLVLEVGSEAFVNVPYYDTESDEEESEEEYSDDEESDEGSEEESEEESEEGTEYEKDEQLLCKCCKIWGHNLWKQSIRHKGGTPYYAFGATYLADCIYDTLYYDVHYDVDENILEDDSFEIVFEGIEFDESESDESDPNNQYRYGGYYYHKSKRESKDLIGYYSRFGFKEDKQVHGEWACFSNLPFPSLRLEI